MLEQTDYSDVFQIEIQLMEKGLPQESIQQLSDTHTRVLKKHLDLHETPNSTPGHPVHTFVMENRVLSKLIQKINLLTTEINKLKD